MRKLPTTNVNCVTRVRFSHLVSDFFCNTIDLLAIFLSSARGFLSFTAIGIGRSRECITVKAYKVTFNLIC